MDWFKNTIKGAAAFSIIAAIVLLAVVFMVIVGGAALAIFAVALPLAILTKPALRHIEPWALRKASSRLAKVNKPGVNK